MNETKTITSPLQVKLFFFPPPISEYFFQQHWESEYFFLEKTITPPPFQVKWSFPNINISRSDVENCFYAWCK
jgi:hypothetical protein